LTKKKLIKSIPKEIVCSEKSADALLWSEAGRGGACSCKGEGSHAAQGAANTAAPAVHCTSQELRGAMEAAVSYKLMPSSLLVGNVCDRILYVQQIVTLPFKCYMLDDELNQLLQT
jgi:hypothetical protein